MAKQATGPVYSASILHKPAGGKEAVFASTELTATTDLSAIQEARVWAISLATDECTVLRVTRKGYQIRGIRMEDLNAPQRRAPMRHQRSRGHA